VTTKARAQTPWWKSAVGYQLYARRFCDTTGDGVGDLEGIRRHLDHVAWLSVDDFASGRRTLRASTWRNPEPFRVFRARQGQSGTFWEEGRSR